MLPVTMGDTVLWNLKPRERRSNDLTAWKDTHLILTMKQVCVKCKKGDKLERWVSAAVGPVWWCLRCEAWWDGSGEDTF